MCALSVFLGSVLPVYSHPAAAAIYRQVPYSTVHAVHVIQCPMPCRRQFQPSVRTAGTAITGLLGAGRATAS